MANFPVAYCGLKIITSLSLRFPDFQRKAEGKALHDHLYSDVGRDVIATVYFFANSESSLLKYVL
ncbi:Serine/threonine protein kinase [methanotrophic endosymbiont of Bathymodiolus azoricus (Menez Gwen)]|nr:Serine/threonine protein kinase [methanotrophic endosymbiont of Bathymodiolus azoricus (Menez Gwen)]